MKQMDAIGAFLANLHALIGHDGAAAFLGTDPGDKAQCILCQYDAAKASREEVINRIGVDRE